MLAVDVIRYVSLGLRLLLCGGRKIPEAAKFSSINLTSVAAALSPNVSS